MNGRDIRTVAVIDIGKSNAKVALVDLGALAERSVRRMPNRPRADGPYPHHDVEGLWAFLLEALHSLAAESRIDAISVTTHGAAAALVDAEGGLALPVLDYEHHGPESFAGEYESVRPAFAETGSPRLPVGLNLGAQLFWQQRTHAEGFARAETILMYPQYWTFRLTGVRASEVTSLGCHTDLWNPRARDFSSLVGRMGWRGRLAPLRPASAALGPILPEVAHRTGLDPATPVLAGIHDSNASLLPHLASRQPPFAVVSTGTWVVAMAVGGAEVALDPARDTLVNVNAFGDPVPSARFMGGREREMLLPDGGGAPTERDAAAVLGQRIMLLPSVRQGCGPFPGLPARWVGRRESSPAEHAVAADFYLALMTATCLDLTGAAGAAIIEGPFAANAPYLDMLAAATGREVLPQAGQATGTSVGAALLARTDRGSEPPTAPARARAVPAPALSRYAAEWREAVGGR
jgi:sugar (pentulose or hexulose) kinase